MDLINKINSVQRQEAIDEDKRISKRALDSEFAFVKRLGEENLPPTQIDKRVGFSIMRYIQLLNTTLRGAFDNASAEKESGEKYIVIDLGRAVYHWNELTLYMKTYKPAERLSNKDYDEFWTELNENILPIANNILNLYEELKRTIGVANLGVARLEGQQGRPRNAGVVFVDRKNLDDLINRIESKNLSIINTTASLVKPQEAPAPDIDTIKQEIEAKMGGELQYFFENPDDFVNLKKEEKRLYNKIRTILKRLKVDDSNDSIREILTDMADDIDVVYPFVEGDEEEEDEEGEEEEEEEGGGEEEGGFVPNPEGFGKPRKNKRVSKKKMGDDEVQLEIEFEDKKQLNHNDKSMKKPVKKKYMVAFDDSKDSNYLK